MHGFILVPAVWLYVQQRGVREHCTILQRGACSRGYKRGERGREAPKSPLEEGLIEASVNIGVQRSICALLVVRSVASYRMGRPP